MRAQRPSHNDIPSQMDVAALEAADKKQVESLPFLFGDDEIQDLQQKYFTLSAHLKYRTNLIEWIKSLIQSDEQGDKILDTIAEQIDRKSPDKMGDKGVKALKSEMDSTMQLVNDGHETREVAIYGFAFHNLNTMAFYDEFGEFVYDRPLREKERQASITSIQVVNKLTGTNNE